MAEEAAAPSQAQKDIRYDWISERVCSSIKGVTQDSFQKLLQSEAKWVPRLLLHASRNHIKTS